MLSLTSIRMIGCVRSFDSVPLPIEDDRDVADDSEWEELAPSLDATGRSSGVTTDTAEG